MHAACSAPAGAERQQAGAPLPPHLVLAIAATVHAVLLTVAFIVVSHCDCWGVVASHSDGGTGLGKLCWEYRSGLQRQNTLSIDRKAGSARRLPPRPQRVCSAEPHPLPSRVPGLGPCPAVPPKLLMHALDRSGSLPDPLVGLPERLSHSRLKAHLPDSPLSTEREPAARQPPVGAGQVLLPQLHCRRASRKASSLDSGQARFCCLPCSSRSSKGEAKE